MQRANALSAVLVAVLLGAGANAARGAGPSDAPAQPPSDAVTAPEVTQEEEPAGQADSAEAARKAHLDSLFEELADPTNTRWERTQAQIYAAWSRSGSPSMDLLAQRADEALAVKDYDTAMLHLNDLTRLAPGFAEGWNKRATVFFLRDDYGRSLSDIARVLSLEPRHFGAYSGLGIILDRLGDKKGALEAYRRATAIHPHLPGAAEGIRKLSREVEGERS